MINQNQLIKLAFYKFIDMHQSQRTQFTKELYLQYYNQLSQSQSSSFANHQLIELTASYESWQIALDLIATGNQAHGSQLLSKKLNHPYTQQLQQILQLRNFIFSLPSLNSILYYCLAKLHIHLGEELIYVQAPYNQPMDTLRILKNLPEAMNAIRITASPNLESERSRVIKTFRQYRNFLMSNFSNYPLLTVECLENFVDNNIKLESSELYSLLLTQELSSVSSILTEVLLTEKYPELTQTTYEYLLKYWNNEATEFLPVFIAFIRSVSVINEPPQNVYIILEKMLQIMRQQLEMRNEDRSNCSYIPDTFLFWSDLSNSIQKQKLNVNLNEQVNICYQAFTEVWKIVINRSIINKIPQFHQISNEENVYELNDVGVFINANVDGSETNKFRDTAEDFLILCYTTLSFQDEFTTRILKYLFDLANSENELNLELSIFALSSILENVRINALDQISQIMETIIKNGNITNRYIWQQLIKLLSKLSPELVSQPQILKTALFVLENSVKIPELQFLSYQSFHEILIACHQSSGKADQIPLLSQFQELLLQKYYFESNQKNFQILTKSFIYYIYYFAESIEVFKQFLSALDAKIQDISTQRKISIIQCLAISHSYIENQVSKKYSLILSQFCVRFSQIFANEIINCENSNQLKSYLFAFKIIVGAVGGYNSMDWAKAIVVIINNPNNNKSFGFRYVDLGIKFLAMNNYDENYLPIISQFIIETEQRVTQLLIQSNSTEYSLIQKCLLFHFEILHRHFSLLTSYHPKPVLSYILQQILNKNFTGYEASRAGFSVLKIFVSKNYESQAIVEKVLIVYPYKVDMFWRSLETILMETYKLHKMEIFKKCFIKVCPQLLPPNPLFDTLETGFAKNDSKIIKNVLTAFN